MTPKLIPTLSYQPDEFQDLGIEPVARVYTDVLKCVFLDRAPEPYACLIELYEGRWNDVSNPAAHRRFKEFLSQNKKAVRAKMPGGHADFAYFRCSEFRRNALEKALLELLYRLM